MAEKDTPPGDGDTKPVADGDNGLTAQLSVFVGDVVNMAHAELNYYRARFAYSQSVAKRIGLYAIISVATFFAAIAALIFGLLLILAAYLGPVIATIIVTVAFLLFAVGAGILARKASKQLSFRDDPSDG